MVKHALDSKLVGKNDLLQAARQDLRHIGHVEGTLRVTAGIVGLLVVFGCGFTVGLVLLTLAGY